MIKLNMKSFTIILLTLIVTTTIAYGKGTKTVVVKNSIALEKEVKELRAKLDVYEKHCPSNAKPLKLTITAAVIGKKLHTSALSKKVKPGQCAISQDHADKLHKWIYVPNVGKVYVADVMPGYWKNRLDLYVTSLSRAKQIGVSIKPVAVLKS